MSGWLNRNREIIFTVLSLLIAAVFGWGFFKVAGFPPMQVAESWQLLLIFMIFLILPFSKKLDFFQFFSFEAKIADVHKDVVEAKEKIADVREDVRHVIAQQNALSASVQSINHQAVTVNNYEGPPQEQVEAATAEVANFDPIEPIKTDPLLEGLSSEDKLLLAIFEDRGKVERTNINRQSQLADLFVDIDDINEIRKINLSERVAVLRVRVERELKRLTGPYSKNRWQYGMLSRRLIPQRELLKLAMTFYPDLMGQRDSFDVFFRIANSAIHADEVPKSDLDTAIYLGERLLGLLTKIRAHDPVQPELPLD